MNVTCTRPWWWLPAVSVFVILALGPGVGHGQGAIAVDQAVRESIQAGGSARVIVELRLSGGTHVAEGDLTPGGAAVQRGNIGDVRRSVYARLLGTWFEVVHEYDSVPLLALRIGAEALAALEADPFEVKRISEDRPRRARLFDSARLVGSPPEARRAGGAITTFDGEGQVIAVLDTGVDAGHPFLRDKVIAKGCFSTAVPSDGEASFCPGGVSPLRDEPGSGAPCPRCDHGTHVAGIAAGAGGTFTYPDGRTVTFDGIAPKARIIAVQVFHATPDGEGGHMEEASTSDFIAALEWIYALRTTYSIAAVNMSLGGELFTAPCDDDETKLIIDNLRAAGIATVVSAGNGEKSRGRKGVESPGCISSAVSVSASTKRNTLADYSDIASFTSLIAPGGLTPGAGILSSGLDNTYVELDGTSMAAPHVAGAFAILKQAKPTASVDSILRALRQTGRDVPLDPDSPHPSVTPSDYEGVPLIQLEGALHRLLLPTAR